MRPTSPTEEPPWRHAGHGSGLELWVARHAEVHADWRGREYGDLDVPLSAGGHQRSRQLGPELAALKPMRVLSSPLARTRHLAVEVAAQAGLELEVEVDLREIHRGSWQGRPVAELLDQTPGDVAAFYADPWNWRGHGGECDAMLSARVWAVIDRLIQGVIDGAAAEMLDARTRPVRLVLVTHYNVVRVLAAGALGIPAPNSFGFRVDPGRVSLFVDGQDGWQLRHSNLVRLPA